MGGSGGNKALPVTAMSTTAPVPNVKEKAWNQVATQVLAAANGEEILPKKKLNLS